MVKKVLWLTLAVVLFAFSGQAMAQPLTAVGLRNFMRGRIAEMRDAPADAKVYFGRAADAFTGYIAQQDGAGGQVFISDLTMAGMAEYKAGRFAEAAATLARVRKTEPDMHEGWSFGGMAEARLGHREQAVELWEAYPVTAGQMYVAEAVRTQAAEVRAGKASLDQAATAVEAALHKQDVYNTHMNRNANLPFTDLCSGQFWWRSADMPCDHGQYPDFD